MFKVFVAATAGTLAALGLWTAGEKGVDWLRTRKSDS